MSYNALRLGQDDDVCIEVLLPFLQHPIRTMLKKKAKVKEMESIQIWGMIEENAVQTAYPDWTLTANALMREYAKMSCRHERDVALLQSHMKRYLRMYAQNALFDLAFTKRYTGKSEACIIATKDLPAGYLLEHLQGTLAPLTEDEDLHLKRNKSDWSILRSSRDGCSQLLLGPARFVNHDCLPNAQFLRVGRGSVAIRTTTAVDCGQEITISYGDHYFGARNCECRCATCTSKTCKREPPNLPDVERPHLDERPFSIRCLCQAAGVEADCPHQAMSPSYETQVQTRHEHTASVVKMELPSNGHSDFYNTKASRQSDIEIQYERHRKLFSLDWPARVKGQEPRSK